MEFNSAFKALKLLKTPGTGRLNNLSDPVLNVLRTPGIQAWTRLAYCQNVSENALYESLQQLILFFTSLHSLFSPLSIFLKQKSKAVSLPQPDRVWTLKDAALLARICVV
jgi:hypothetical protein